MEVGVHEAKTHLSQLLRQVSAGEEIVINNGGEPVARLVAVEPRVRRVLGADRGLFTVTDVDTPLPDEIQADFEP